MVTQAQVQDAINMYRAGRRPGSQGTHYDWHVIDTPTDEYFSLKVIWALIHDIDKTNTFHSAEAQGAMREAGISLVNLDATSLRPGGREPARRKSRELFDMLDESWLATSERLGERFTTQDYRAALEKVALPTWKELQRRYGRGGKGSGNFYSPSNILFNFLKDKERHGIVTYLTLVPSRDGWGSRLVAEWNIASEMRSPPVSEEDRQWWEGKERLKTHLVRERARGIRDDVLRSRRAAGLRCEICDLDGQGLDHDVRDALFEVHHSKELFSGKGIKAIKAADMALLCACCHRLIHRIIRVSGDWIMPAEAKKLIGKLR